jgi:formyltetrahydrofolate deformylase
LLVSCADRPGIIAAISRFLNDHGANIIESDQYSTDPVGGRFFLRTVFHRAGLSAMREELEQRFAAEVGRPFGMQWRFTDPGLPKRAAVMVSRFDHCLLDLLWRARRHELDLEVGVVISNHPDLADDVRAFGVPYVHIPVTRETKPEAERRQVELLAGTFIVMARYMQILSADFLEAVAVPVINIHHSFLPAFAGAGPYRQARDRGVKLIGATAHYATQQLDEGPIIEQDVVRASHRDSAEALERRGADVERTVLTRAVQWHCEDRVVRDGERTIVF